MEQLIKEIVNCRNIVNYSNDSSDSNPCTIILNQQRKDNKTFQLPEPWSGNIKDAPMLFIGSNPGICTEEEYPVSAWLEEDIFDFFINRFSKGKKLWVKKYLYPLLQGEEGGYKKNWVRYWAAIKSLAIKISGNRNIIPGKDYAITEVVHCKSKGEKYGVRQALNECTSLYMDKVLSLSGAKIIICLGKFAGKAIREKYHIEGNDKLARMVIIGNIPRSVMFLPHPNSRKPNKSILKEDLLRMNFVL
ncbi:MAG: hypothetical protein PHG48_08010 [Eubacteriales bacterium]|nr:hypothetical protein [Eubacteriales bacterium]